MFKLSYGWTAILLLFVFGFTSCDDDDDNGPALVSITDTAVADGRFTTLVSALQRTGLDAVLDGTGTYTVFAPTDAAFAASGIDLASVSDEDLTNLLRYHVLGLTLNSTTLTGDGDLFAPTLGNYGPGGTALSVMLNKTGTVLTVNGDATVVAADVAASNGIIHAVDEVLSPQTIVDFTVKSGVTSELEAALGAAGLVDDLSGTDPLTVFAPVNEAFAAISSTVAGLSSEQLVDVLTYHVVSGNVPSTGLSVSQVPTLNTTNTIDVRQDAGTFYVQNGDSRTDFIITDIQGTNGVIHLINEVLIPSDL